MMNERLKRPNPFVSLIPVVILITLLYFTIRTLGSDALGGASQVCMLVAAAFCVLIGTLFYRRTWKDFEQAITANISGIATALLILLIIGSLSGAWMISGVIPTFIYYGIQIIHPGYFLVCTCIICAIVSVMTGSSWTTIATIGIALMGIGRAQGFDEGWIAGAIISGAYFGDKISPLSDTTVLASSVSGVSLFKHIRYMLVTTTPSMLIALLIFTIAGLRHESADMSEIAVFTWTLAETFDINGWLMIVPVATAVLIALRMPPLITLFLSTLLAMGFAIGFQPDLLREIAGSGIENIEALFIGSVKTLYGSTAVQTGHTALNELVATRGMAGMMDTVWLILCAMCFGGAMTAGGMLEGITSVFARAARKSRNIVTSTVGAGLFLNLTTGDQYISIILTSKIFRRIYEECGYENRLLSRTTEDAVTVTSVLVPWNSCGMTQATVLGVATLTYLPYCFFNLLSPLMSVIVAAIGYKITQRKLS